MVYCLSNDVNNHECDECQRCVDGGVVQVTRPICIARYNKSIGGVYLADMKRMQCSSSLMGQGRWWLKLFFYSLDVGTGNALVLYNELLKIRAQGKEYKRWNLLAQFKMQLIEDLVGKSANDLFSGSNADDVLEHICVPIPDGRRVKCAYCGLMTQECRTRYMCAACGVTLCSMGSGKVNYKMVQKKHLQMQMKNPQRYKK
jgi:hypothetical protein